MKQYIFPNKNRKHAAGFTLVEMLTVVAIFVVIGSIIMSILITSFRTSQKTEIITAIQHSGNYAILQMTKTIRDARGLITPFPCVPSVSSSTLSILTPDDQKVTYVCAAASGGTPATIASNGASLLDTTQVALTSCSFVCSQNSPSDLPLVTINFSLLQHTSSTFVEQIASQSAINFQTSIVLRNINR